MCLEGEEVGNEAIGQNQNYIRLKIKIKGDSKMVASGTAVREIV